MIYCDCYYYYVQNEGELFRSAEMVSFIFFSLHVKDIISQLSSIIRVLVYNLME